MQRQRFDRKRKGKKASNNDWKSPTAPDSRITKTKDGTTRLAYKGERAVDLETNMVIAVTTQLGHAADSETVKEMVIEAHPRDGARGGLLNRASNPRSNRAQLTPAGIVTAAQ